MRYCVQCQRRLTMEELTWQTGGQCFACFWPDPATGRPAGTHEDESAYWRSDEAMEND